MTRKQIEDLVTRAINNNNEIPKVVDELFASQPTYTYETVMYCSECLELECICKNK